MQGNKLYCGNLNYSVTNEQLEDLFGNYGEVKSVNIIQGKGFGFVEMADADQATKAQEALNGQNFEGRTIRVDEARPRQERPARNFNRNRGDYRNRY